MTEIIDWIGNPAENAPRGFLPSGADILPYEYKKDGWRWVVYKRKWNIVMTHGRYGWESSDDIEVIGRYWSKKRASFVSGCRNTEAIKREWIV